ncbi:hypothetical protein L2E82_11007 [Cichorium intybus]|uniref:Uncharacterized protein n=1 Tax=Cichorium intybus TaxID=13427 RepID=A0ACB9GD69_CICIN|nr:hypothetical protein L2E82_11007 [Cichorium intybus]
MIVVLGIFSADKRSDVRLYYGARNLQRMAYQDRFKSWESSGVTIVPVLSQPTDNWAGESGYVQAAFARAKQIYAPESNGVVLCGKKQMAEVNYLVFILFGKHIQGTSKGLELLNSLSWKFRTLGCSVASWRVKETERMIAICTELRKLGATVEEGPDYCVITPTEKLSVTAIDTYDDHRMAMAFSLAACADMAETIKDPGFTRKKFPNYFELLQRFANH